MNLIRRRLSRRGRGLRRHGGVALEFALVLPVVLLLLTGGADIVLWLRAWFRVERVATEVGTVASQYQTLAQADITRLFNAGQLIAGTTSVSGSGGAQVISLVSSNTNGTANVLTWQCKTGSFVSRIGNTVGGSVTLPDRFLVPLGQTVLVTEAFNRNTPWVFSNGLFGTTGSDVIYSYTVVRPRSAQLSTPPTSGCP